MTAQNDLERRLAEHYAQEGLLRAPDRVLGNALATIETTTQRRVLVRVPWRFPTMSNTMRLAAVAVAVIALAGVGLALTGRFGGNGVGGPAPTVSPTIAPSPTSSAPLSALSETFTSNRYGISIGYPAGWITKAATKQALDADVSFPGPETDLIYDPGLRDNLFLSLSSLPLDKAVPAEWIAATAATLECAGTQPITVDGASGALCSSGTSALVPIGGRGYVIRLYTGDAATSLESIYSPAWFKTVLDTVKLSPEKTVTGSPTPS
jgi:hypothetical protein